MSGYLSSRILHVGLFRVVWAPLANARAMVAAAALWRVLRLQLNANIVADARLENNILVLC